MRAAIALGSNQGNCLEQMSRAKKMLRPFHKGDNSTFLQSPIYKTAPVNCPEGSPDFYNAVIEFDWIGSSRKLLELTQSIEFFLGRKKNDIINAPRPIDLDILYIDDNACDDFELTLPHPRLVQRGFVLYPLAQIAPHKIIPGTHKTALELLQDLPDCAYNFELITTSW